MTCNKNVEEGEKITRFWNVLRPAARDWIRRVDRQRGWVWIWVLVRTAGQGFIVLLYVNDVLDWTCCADWPRGICFI